MKRSARSASTNRRRLALAALAAVGLFAAMWWWGRTKPSGSADATAGAPPAPAAPEPGWEIAQTPRQWKYVVVHHSASARGNYQAIHRLHIDSRKWEGCGYHFVIGNGTLSGDGEVEIGFRWKEQKHGAHAGTGAELSEFNNHGVGVCLVGDFTRESPTEAQMAALARLTRFLMERYGIPRERVIGHGDIRNTDCPGKCFSRRELLERIEGKPPATAAR
jgi:N-acetyl-anhydromuramyl-L-alanine amidase AmpD